MRRHLTRALALAACLLAAGAAHAAPPKGGPDLAQCPRSEAPGLEEGNERTRPLPVPRPLANIVRARLDQLAVVTLTGATFCVDARAIHIVEDMRLGRKARFLGFNWYGYEEYGHIFVDRSGNGSMIDTGSAPLFSPSGQLLAAAQQSGAGFGALEGMAIWRVLPEGLERIAMFGEIPEMTDWRIDGWANEQCINLSAVPNERIPESRTDLTQVSRDRYVAVQTHGEWRFERNDKGCPAR